MQGPQQADSLVDLAEEKGLHLNVHKALCLVICLLLTFPCPIAILYARSDRDLLMAATPAALLCLIWAVFRGVQIGRRDALLVSVVVTGIASGLLLLHLAGRSLFVIQNNSMEGPDGFGSPLAFMIGLVSELFLFILFAATTWFGVGSLRKTRPEPQQSTTGEP